MEQNHPLYCRSRIGYSGGFWYLPSCSVLPLLVIAALITVLLRPVILWLQRKTRMSRGLVVAQKFTTLYRSVIVFGEASMPRTMKRSDTRLTACWKNTHRITSRKARWRSRMIGSGCAWWRSGSSYDRKSLDRDDQQPGLKPAIRQFSNLNLRFS